LKNEENREGGNGGDGECSLRRRLTVGENDTKFEEEDEEEESPGIGGERW
jgi:hypothetical protein